MPTSAPPIIHAPETVALAYELRTGPTKIRWRLLERYLGKGIRDAVERAKRNGISHIIHRR